MWVVDMSYLTCDYRSMHRPIVRSRAPIWMCGLLLSACQFSASERTVDATTDRLTVGFAAATSPMVDERSGPVQVAVVLSQPSDRPVTVHCAVTGGTATQGTDFMIDDIAVGFLPGETEKTVTVTIVRDTLEEPHETIVLG